MNRQIGNTQKKFDDLNGAYTKLQRDYDELKSKYRALNLQLEQKQTELQVVKKAIELEKVKQLNEEQRTEADKKYLAVIENFLYTDDFTTNYLKSLGNRKRIDRAGNIKEVNIYSAYLEAKERFRKRAMAKKEDFKRPLPKVGSDDGGKLFRSTQTSMSR